MKLRAFEILCSVPRMSSHWKQCYIAAGSRAGLPCTGLCDSAGPCQSCHLHPCVGSKPGLPASYCRLHNSFAACLLGQPHLSWDTSLGLVYAGLPCTAGAASVYVYGSSSRTAALLWKNWGCCAQQTSVPSSLCLTCCSSLNVNETTTSC